MLPSHHTACMQAPTWKRGQVFSQPFTTKPGHCETAWSEKKGKMHPKGSSSQTWLCHESLVFTLRPADSRLPHPPQWEGQSALPCSKVTDMNLELMSYSQSCCTSYLGRRVPWWQPLKLNSVKCFGDDTFPLYAKKNLSTLKKLKPKYKVPPIAKGRHSTFRRYPAEDRGQQTDCSVWPSCSELKSKKEFGACEFWCSLKDAELESSGQSRVLFSQKTTVLVPELYWKRQPFWGATEASHQTSKPACKTLPLGKGLSAPIHPIGNIRSFSHLMGSEKCLAADCI